MKARHGQVQVGDWIRWHDENNEDHIQVVVRVENWQIYTKETGKFWLTRNDIQEVRAVSTIDQARAALKLALGKLENLSKFSDEGGDLTPIREAIAAMEAQS